MRTYATVSVTKEDNNMAEATMNHEKAAAAAANENSFKEASANEVNFSLSASPLSSLANATDAVGTTAGEPPCQL